MSRAKIDFSKPLEVEGDSDIKVRFIDKINNHEFPYVIVLTVPSSSANGKEYPANCDEYGFLYKGSADKGLIIRNVPEKEIDWEKPLKLRGFKQILRFVGEYPMKPFPFCCIVLDKFGIPDCLKYFDKYGHDRLNNENYFAENYEE